MPRRPIRPDAHTIYAHTIYMRGCGTLRRAAAPRIARPRPGAHLRDGARPVPPRPPANREPAP